MRKGGSSLTYLGVSLFVGSPKRCHFQLLIDKIQDNLEHWKGLNLSMAGRKKCCKSKEDEGLGIRDPSILNAAFLKKLSWSLMTSDSFVFRFLRERFFSSGFTQRRFPLLADEIYQTTIGETSDSLMWHQSANGDISCADAYKSMAGVSVKER
ncbi:hypothetical protein PanWU01x14_307900 [Parasponia andersonii]|uniref:Uncharacterized protein n=1 Tax=Parasponia andersonii TaxID=3476 RepID=A0A2P5AR69_PARAD|nr:hypothetical protein PanWU01x14_307900 [Parasponia andersonii]